MSAPEPRSPSRAGNVLPVTALVLAVLLIGVKAWLHLAPAVDGLGASGLRAETRRAPVSPRLTRIDDSIFRPLQVPAVDPFGYPANTVDKREIAGLLARGEYGALERRLEEIHRRVIRDVRYEYHLVDAFVAFQRSDPAMGARLDEWVRRSPGSAHALIARGSYRLSAGWDARGARWASTTPDSQLHRFRQLAELAVRDLRAGLAADGKHLVGHYLLLNLAKAFAPDREIRRLLEAGLASHRDSYALRDQYMTSVEPRWGGSYAKMRAFGKESARHAGRNPRLAALRGAEHVYRAWEHRRSDDHAAALAEYEAALRYGQEREVLLQRGRTYYQMEDYVRAHADLERALQQRPQGPEALEYHGRSLYQIARALPPAIRGTALARAEADFALLAGVDPDNDDVAEWRGHVRRMQRWCASLPEPCR